MALPHDSPSLRKFLLGAGAAVTVAAAVFGGYRYAAREPVEPVAGIARLSAARPAGPPLCAGAARVAGATGAVCQRPVPPAKGALP